MPLADREHLEIHSRDSWRRWLTMKHGSYEDLVHRWAASNKRRVEVLIDMGLMAPAGLTVIERAKADGSWTKLSAQER